jgi:hypothetical protein
MGVYMVASDIQELSYSNFTAIWFLPKVWGDLGTLIFQRPEHLRVKGARTRYAVSLMSEVPDHIQRVG